MGIVLITIIVIMLFWPAIQRWLARQAARRAEDYLRRATGMPPRPDSREGQRRERHRQQQRRQQQRRREEQRQRREYANDLQEVAEDVEFTETVQYSETRIAGEKPPVDVRSFNDSQVSDAKWSPLKDKP